MHVPVTNTKTFKQCYKVGPYIIAGLPNILWTFLPLKIFLGAWTARPSSQWLRPRWEYYKACSETILVFVFHILSKNSLFLQFLPFLVFSNYCRLLILTQAYNFATYMNKIFQNCLKLLFFCTWKQELDLKSRNSNTFTAITNREN